MNKVRTGHYTFPEAEWGKVSLQAKDLISRLLDRHPRTRISAEQAIRHQWFTMHMPDSVANEPLGKKSATLAAAAAGLVQLLLQQMLLLVQLLLQQVLLQLLC